jgi:hypothetical protein
MRKAIVLLRLVPLLFLGAATATHVAACGSGGKCCKICKTGKPCGDTCIASSDQCTKGAGCACSGLTAP